MKNFLFTAPPWLSNLLSIVLAVLIAISTIGNEVMALFTDLNCEQCLKITQKVLSVAAIALAIAKALSKVNTTNTEVPKINTTVIALLIFSGGYFSTQLDLTSKFFGSDPQYHQSSTPS